MLKEEYDKGLCNFYEKFADVKLDDENKALLTKLYHQFNNFNGTIVSGRTSNKTWVANMFQAFVIYDIVYKKGEIE